MDLTQLYALPCPNHAVIPKHEARSVSGQKVLYSISAHETASDGPGLVGTAQVLHGRCCRAAAPRFADARLAVRSRRAITNPRTHETNDLGRPRGQLAPGRRPALVGTNGWPCRLPRIHRTRAGPHERAAVARRRGCSRLHSAEGCMLARVETTKNLPVEFLTSKMAISPGGYEPRVGVSDARPKMQRLSAELIDGIAVRRNLVAVVHARSVRTNRSKARLNACDLGTTPPPRARGRSALLSGQSPL